MSLDIPMTRKKIVSLPESLQKISEEVNITDLTLVETLAMPYVTFINQIDEQLAIYKTLQKGNAADCDKAKRVALDLGKLCARVGEKKKEQKEYYTKVTKYIDGLHNAIEGKARLLQADAKAIADHFENMERQRIMSLNIERTAALEKYCPDAASLKLGEMEQQSFDSLLEAYKIKFEKEQEAKKIAEELAEKERIEKEEREEKLRKENEDLQKAIKAKNELRSNRNLQLAAYTYVYTGKDLAEETEEAFQAFLKDAIEKKKQKDKEDADRKLKEQTQQERFKSISTYISFLPKELDLSKLYELPKKKYEDYLKSCKEAFDKSEQDRLNKEAELKKLKDEADKKDAEDKKKIEDAKKLEKASDVVKLGAWIKDFKSPPVKPLCKAEKANAIVNEIENKFNLFTKWAEKQVQEL